VIYSGDYGKGRPAIVLQADAVSEAVDSVIVCLLTTTLRDAPLFRLMIDPTPENGLREVSQAMVEKTGAVSRDKIGTRIGRITEAQIDELGRRLAFVLGLRDA